MINHALYLKLLSPLLDLCYRRLGKKIQSFYVVLFENQLGDLLEEGDFLKKKMNIQLVLALILTLIVSLHAFPI